MNKFNPTLIIEDYTDKIHYRLEAHLTNRGVALYGGQRVGLSMDDKTISLTHEQMSKLYVWYTQYLRERDG